MMKPLLFLLSLSLAPAFMCHAQEAGYPDFELVESTPIGTILDNPDIRNTHGVWLEMINAAAKTLDFEEFYVSNQQGEPLDDIIRAIREAAHRGVVVRFIVDSRMHKTYPEPIDSLAKFDNISVRVIDFGKLAGGIQHSKYFTVDGQEVFVGSQNFDWRALSQIHELGLRIKNKEAVKIYQDVFDLDWELAEKSDPAEIRTLLHPVHYPLPIRVVEGPGDTLMYSPTYSPRGLIPDSALWDETSILKLIDGATHDILLQFLTYSPLTYEHTVYTVLNDALFRAAHRGVRIKLIVSDWEKSPRQVTELKRLAEIPNIEVKFSAIPDLPSRYIAFARVEHCKYIVADSSRCWVGSSNAEKSYFYNTRNVGVLIRSRTMAGLLRRIFMKDWNGPYTELIGPEGEYKLREHGEPR